MFVKKKESKWGKVSYKDRVYYGDYFKTLVFVTQFCS